MRHGADETEGPMRHAADETEALQSPRAPAVWRVYLAVGICLLCLYYLVPALKGNGVIFNLIGLSSAVAMVVGVRLHKPKTLIAWYLFAAGHTLFVIGDLFYYSASALFHIEVSFPSLGDFFYLSVYPALVAGLLVLIQRRNPRGDRASLIDALIISTGLALLAWVFLMAPHAHDAALTLVQKLVSIAYPGMDVLLLAVAVRLSVDNGTRRPALFLVVGSILSLLTADALLGILTLQGGYEEGGLLDIGWAAYYLLWGAAALHPSMRSIEKPAPGRETRLTRGRLVMLTAAAMFTPAVRVIQEIRGETVDEPVLIGGSIALYGLVIARMWALLQQYERSVGRERSLREAGKALVAASSREEVYTAALEGMLSLVGPGHEARLTLHSSSGDLRVAACSGTATMTESDWIVRYPDLSELDSRALLDGHTVELAVGSSGLQEALKLPREIDRLLALPLFVRGELRGLFFMAGAAHFSIQVKDTLQSLAANVSLALESVALTEDLLRRQSEARFQSLVQNSSDLITVIEADSTIKYQSPSVEKVLGYQPEQLIGLRLGDMLHPHETDRVLSLLTEGLGGAGGGDVVDCRLRHRDGWWLHFEILRTNLLHDPNVGGIVLNGRDVSERKAFEDQLTHQAFHDPLTNLANRALFSDRVQHALSRQARESSGLAVIFIDLDDFKIINDSLGHGAGDGVLAEVGRRMNGCMRPMDTLARFGGDEFAVLLEDVAKPQEVAEVAERLLKGLEAPFSVENKEVFVRASMGITIVRGDEALTLGADELMRNADVAMYMAKRDGKGTYRVFEPAMHAGVVERLELKGDLQRAIEAGDLRLNYQPVVTMAGERIEGFEALVRWEHPTRGPIPPLQFIPLAEETGLIVPLGRWVLGEACRQARLIQDRFPQDPPLGMAVNLSVRQLQHPVLVQQVVEALTESGLDPGSLTLEITESVLMSDAQSTIVRLGELKAVGVRLAVDDFGTGYSSLSYLSQFPVDILKIDRAFVRPVADGVEESALAAAIVKLGDALHLQTVAEGIEHRDQMSRLVQLGCDKGQGYYFAKPMELDQVLEFLHSAGADTQAQAPLT
jgi:diguanylate cyclase (GGDEF)-like protein/PAS domain S-box-containing protein